MTEAQLIKKGFNHGYSMHESESELAEKISAGFRDLRNPYAEGFISGTIQCMKDKGLFLDSPDINSDKSIDIDL